MSAADHATALTAWVARAEAGASLSELSRGLRNLIASAGIGPAEIEARALVGHATGLDLTGIVRHGGEPLSRPAIATLAEAARRRLAGEPLARILGVQSFYGRDFRLSPETLVPRADTEALVDAVLHHWRERPRTTASNVPGPIFADLGVGSGAILVTLLAEHPDATGVATDLSLDALATARANAERHGVGARALFLRSSYSDALAEGRFDAIVSNPPYIRTDVIDTLEREVREHDPHLALDGGADGLDAYRAIATDSRRVLRPDGLLAVEIGHDQGQSVPPILARAGFTEIRVSPDLAGRDRVVTARRRS